MKIYSTGSQLLSGLNKDLFEKFRTIHVSRLRRHQSGKIKILILNLIQAGIPTEQNADQVFRTFINDHKVTAELSQGLHHMQSVSTITAVCGKGNIRLNRAKQNHYNDAVDLP